MSRPSYPWPDAPRQFVAAAMPQGDREFDVPGPLVMLVERRGEALTRQRFYTGDEARALAAALAAAIEALEAGEEWDRQLGKPSLRRHRLIDRSHRTMAEIMAEEAALAHPVIVGIDLACGDDQCVVNEVRGGRVANVQHHCRACGHWRASRCKYSTCPLPGGDHG